MKTRLYLQQWLDLQARRQTVATDAWYLRLANELLPMLRASDFLRQAGRGLAEPAALKLSLYLHDAVAQQGGWAAFKEAYRRLYHAELPFYPVTEPDYVPDEVNPDDVALVLWTLVARPAAKTPDDFTLHDPHDPQLTALARDVYSLMDARFEEAPISETPSPDDWLMDVATLRRPSLPLPEVPTGEVPGAAGRCLAHSGGEPLLFFPTYAELSRFFVQVLGWEDRPDHLLPDLQTHSRFVLYANAKGMLIAPDAASYFHAPHNPLYDEAETRRTGYRLFCRPGACPFDLLKYGMHRDYLSAAALPFADGHRFLQTHWDFIARYYLEEYYEGD